MPTKDRERLLVGGAVMAALLMLLVGYFALVGPQRGKTRNIEAQVADATTQNSVLSNKISTLSQQNRDLKKYEQDLATQEKALPSENDLNTFLRTLEGLGTATSSDASFTAGSPVDVTAGQTVTGQDFRVAIRIVSEPSAPPPVIAPPPGMPTTGAGIDLRLPLLGGLGLLMMMLGLVQRRRALR